MRIKHKPEDFIVREAYRLNDTPRGEHYVYLMDKQKLSTFEAVERIARANRLKMSDFSFCGLKDKQGRTEQIIAVKGARVEMHEPDLRLKPLCRVAEPLSAENLTANRFVVTVRDLSIEEAERVPESVKELRSFGFVNYFDSQRFGGVKHGQGFLGKDLAAGRIEHALQGYMARPSPLDKTEDSKVKAFWARNWGDWSARCPYPRVAHYRPILNRLRRDPRDFVSAFMAIESRYRGLVLFEYQSYLWNESVRRYLLGRLGKDGHLSLRYQAGLHIFPRSVEDLSRLGALKDKPFPLVGPDSLFDDPEVEKAVRDTLAKEKLSIDRLGLPDLPRMGMKHEDRALIIVPPKLSVVDPRPDELHPGRLKVTLAFTLPSGAYATLLVKRTLWFATSDTVEAGGPLPQPTPGFVPEHVLQQMSSSASRAQGRRHRRARPSHGIEVENRRPEALERYGRPEERSERRPAAGRGQGDASGRERRPARGEGEISARDERPARGGKKSAEPRGQKKPSGHRGPGRGPGARVGRQPAPLRVGERAQAAPGPRKPREPRLEDEGGDGSGTVAPRGGKKAAPDGKKAAPGGKKAAPGGKKAAPGGRKASAPRKGKATSGARAGKKTASPKKPRKPGGKAKS